MPAPMTASLLCAPLLDGLLQPLHVASQTAAVYQLADEAGVVRACVSTMSALRLPHALELPTLPTLPPLPARYAAKPAVVVGGGRLRWGDSEFSVTRWWAPARPHLPALRDRIDGGAADRLLTEWRRQLGSGDGLTPYADDVLCGALVGLHAAGSTRAHAVSADVLSTDLEQFTTATSAALLRCAANGWCLDAVADYLVALATGRGLSAATAALVRIGASSGRGMLEGISGICGLGLLDAAA